MENQLWKDKYYQCLALEFSDPEYFKVHHLLVITYLLQTGGYSAARRPIAIRLLNDFLTNSASPKSVQLDYERLRRTQNRPIETPELIPHTDWEMTIMDIRTTDPTEYCEDITRWAATVLAAITALKSYTD